MFAFVAADLLPHNQLMSRESTFRWWWVPILGAAAALPRLPAVFEGVGIEDLAYLQYAAEHSGPAAVFLEPWPYGFYRPLVTLQFELFHPIFGDWAAGYHLVSLTLHVLVTWLVYLLLSSTVKNPRVAFLAALIFAVLPSHTEAIAWACSVGDLWAAAFVISSVRLAIAAPDQPPDRARWFWIGAILAALAACGAKESAVAVAVVAPSAAWLFAERRAHWAWLVSFPALIAGYFIWYGTRTPRLGTAAFLIGWPTDWLKRFFQDLGMILIPIRRGPIGDWIWSEATLTWVWTLGGMALAAWFIIGAIRSGDRTMLFGWLWAVLFFFPSWRLGWAERYSYLPSVGLILVVAALINRVPEKRWKPVTACVLVLVTLLALSSGVAAANWGWN